MKVIILAAGMGTRFIHDEKKRPKCLLTVRGRTLLGINIENIFSADPGANIVVVTGFMADQVEEYLKQTYPMEKKIKTAYNADFAKTVVFSIKKGFRAVSSDESVLLMNGDTLFNRVVFEKARDISVLDADAIIIFGNKTKEFSPDDMKLSVSDSSVQHIGKNIQSANAVSSGAILLCGRGLQAYLDIIANESVDKLKTHHGILQSMLDQGRGISFGDLGPVNWIEIDRSKDLEQDFSIVLDW